MFLYPLVVLLFLFGRAASAQTTGQSSPDAISETSIPLMTILPKLQAIHEDAKSLLIKNGELKAKILDGLQAQNDAKLKLVKEGKLATNPVLTQVPGKVQPQSDNQQLPVQPHQVPPPANPQQQQFTDKETEIDYSEMEEFNKWVEVNLEYAVKNTQLSIETLREEASQNNGRINYSEQAIKDGIEGVKYWQSAVIFQDKTLKNEKYEIE